MTTAPAHPPVHGYDGADPYETIPSKWGSLERWRVNALATGETSALTELSKQVRNDTASIVARQDARESSLNAREDALNARERELGVKTALVTELMGRVAVEQDRINKFKARVDAEQEPLATPPGSSKEPDPPQPPESDQSEFPTEPLALPPVVSQPVSPGLDKE